MSKLLRARSLFKVVSVVCLISLAAVTCQPTWAASLPQDKGTPAAPPGPKKRLTLGSTNSASSHYVYMIAAAQSINRGVPEVNVTVSESGAAYDNIKRMLEKEFDLGLVNDLAAYEAYNGLPPFKKKNEGLRVLWYYIANPIIFAVRADSGVKTIQDLAGNRFSPGTKGSGAVQIVENVMNSLGVKPNYYVGGLDDAVAAAKDRRIVGFAKGASSLTALDASVQDLGSQTEVRILKFAPAEEKKILAAFPYYAFVTVPEGVYAGQGAIRTIGSAIMMGTFANLIDEDLGYKIAKAANENKSIQEAAFRPVKEVKYPDLTLKLSLIPLHAGTVRYFKELGVTVPQKLIPPEYKGR